MPEPQQLSLGVTLSDEATFDNFYARAESANAQVVELLRAQAKGSGEQFIFLWGSEGSGLSHLLQASCHAAHDLGLGFQYLPLEEVADAQPAALLEGLEELDIVCLDNLDAVVGRPGWEEALFHLYNRLRHGGGALLVSATLGPHQLPIALADLGSRLRWGITCQLHELEDADKQQALRHRARVRGLELSDEVAHYILQRLPRDMNALVDALRQLDRASLAEQRRLTIPFVKKVLKI